MTIEMAFWIELYEEIHFKLKGESMRKKIKNSKKKSNFAPGKYEQNNNRTC